MDWLKPTLLVLQAGLHAYLSENLIDEPRNNGRTLAIRSVFRITGVVVFIFALIASVLMFFIDLGNQFELNKGVHFSGMMLSASILLGSALVFLGVCFGIANMMLERQHRKELAIRNQPNTEVLLFAKDFLTQLITSINQMTPPLSRH